LVITGHFHKYQHKGNIVYGGSPFQLGFEEMGCEKGFLVLDTKTITVEFVKNLFSPTYMEIDLDKITSIDDFSELDVKNKFVGVIMREKVDNFIKLKHVLYEKGALDITPKYENEKNDILTSDEKPVEFNKNVDDMFLEFIKNNIKLEGIDNNRLVDIFEEIKEEIEA
jgi:DNA repair exonuclease SbcCD nuclease subunit